jgi:hypothetical protein
MTAEREKAIQEIVTHLQGKSDAYRKSFEQTLAAGGVWDNKLKVFEWFGRYIKIGVEGELIDL